MATAIIQVAYEAETTSLKNTVNEINQNTISVYNKAKEEWNASYRKASHLFEEERQKEIEKTAALRIAIDPRFQAVIDMFLKEAGE